MVDSIISEELVDSVLASIVRTAETKSGVDPGALLTSVMKRVRQEQPTQVMPSNNKRRKIITTGSVPISHWWKSLPRELTPYVLDFLPRQSLADVSECSHECNKLVEDYARSRLIKTDLGKSLIKRHLDGTSLDRGTFSPAFLLYCHDAAPAIGAYFSSKNIHITQEYNAIMRSMYPNDIYCEYSYLSWGRVMFVIDGIVVGQAIEGDRVGMCRFRVCRCPLPVLVRFMERSSVEAWISGGRVKWQNDMENLWREGWTMYDEAVGEV